MDVFQPPLRKGTDNVSTHRAEPEEEDDEEEPAEDSQKLSGVVAPHCPTFLEILISIHLQYSSDFKNCKEVTINYY